MYVFKYIILCILVQTKESRYAKIMYDDGSFTFSITTLVELQRKYTFITAVLTTESVAAV